MFIDWHPLLSKYNSDDIHMYLLFWIHCGHLLRSLWIRRAECRILKFGVAPINEQTKPLVEVQM